MKLTEPQRRMLLHCDRHGGQWVGGATARTARILRDAGLLCVVGYGNAAFRNPRVRVALTALGHAEVAAFAPSEARDGD